MQRDATGKGASSIGLLGRIPALVLIERVCAYLTLRDVAQLASASQRVLRLVRSGVCMELLTRQRLQDELRWFKGCFLDRVRVTIAESNAGASFVPSPDSPPRPGPPSQEPAPALLQSRVLRAKEAEIEELRRTTASQRMEIKALAHEVVRLREEVLALEAAKERSVELLGAISQIVGGFQ